MVEEYDSKHTIHGMNMCDKEWTAAAVYNTLCEINNFWFKNESAVNDMRQMSLPS